MKNTFIKILCLVLVCATILPMVVACGEKALVTFNANGGTCSVEEVEIPVGSSFVEEGIKFPSASRPGYTFAGWYEDGDEDEEYSKKDLIQYDLELVALWTPNGKEISVEFDAGSGLLDTSLLAGSNYINTVSGVKLGELFATGLPTATRDEYYFEGWKTSDGKKVGTTTSFEDDVVLEAIWERIIYCFDGTENHSWMGWVDGDEATCETPSERSNTCSICGHIDKDTEDEALGHMYADWSYDATNPFRRTRSCQRPGCVSLPQTQDLRNIAPTSGSAKLDGGQYGAGTEATLLDGDFTTTSLAGNAQSVPLTLTYTFTTPKTADVIMIGGQGSRGYNVSITYEDGTEANLGIGSFGSVEAGTHIKRFEVPDNTKNIVKVVVYQESGSWSDYWGEIAICTMPE